MLWYNDTVSYEASTAHCEKGQTGCRKSISYHSTLTFTVNVTLQCSDAFYFSYKYLFFLLLIHFIALTSSSSNSTSSKTLTRSSNMFHLRLWGVKKIQDVLVSAWQFMCERNNKIHTVQAKDSQIHNSREHHTDSVHQNQTIVVWAVTADKLTNPIGIWCHCLEGK